MKYKLKIYDELNDIYLLYRHKFWFFWSFVGVGSKDKLTRFVKEKGGTLIK